MKRVIASVASAAMLAFALLPVSAQQVPVTGQMMVSSSTAPPSSMPAAPLASVNATPARYNSAPVDETTTAPVAAKVRTDSTPRRITSSASRSHGAEVGETTRSLLQMQADDNRPGTPLPMLGAEASASYARYLKSFNHDIPEFYETRVGKDNSGGSGSGQQ